MWNSVQKFHSHQVAVPAHWCLCEGARDTSERCWELKLCLKQDLATCFMVQTKEAKALGMDLLCTRNISIYFFFHLAFLRCHFCSHLHKPEKTFSTQAPLQRCLITHRWVQQANGASWLGRRRVKLNTSTTSQWPLTALECPDSGKNLLASHFSFRSGNNTPNTQGILNTLRLRK